MNVPATNLFARYLLNDDKAQARRVERLLADMPFRIAETVVLELVWVLETCGCDRGEVLAGISHIAGLPGATVSDEAALALALVWYGAGMDFADAWHLARCGHGDEFVTFDKSLVNKTRRLNTHRAARLCP